MRTELQQALVKDFPRVSRDWGGDPRVTCMAFGFDVGDGWEPIIRRMCACMEALAVVPRLEQVKEKWGLLRVYASGGATGGVRWWGWPAVLWLAAGFLLRYGRSRHGLRWDLRCAVEYGMSVMWRQTAAEKRQAELSWNATDLLVEEAERASESVCEDCGKPGRLRAGGWYRTLCDDCHTACEVHRLRLLGQNPQG